MRELKAKPRSTVLNPGRRRILGYSLLGFAGLGALVFNRVLADEAPNEIGAWLTRLVHDSSAAAKLGSNYLTQFPEEAKAKTLSQLIELSLDNNNASPKSFTRFKSAIASVIREEYRTDSTVQVDGWLLSRTEARLYALGALRFTG